MSELKDCPFCGGPVQLERPLDAPKNSNEWWGIVCRNTLNRGGSCAIHQVPSRTKDAAIDRWNRRAIPADQVLVPREALERCARSLTYMAVKIDAEWGSCMSEHDLRQDEDPDVLLADELLALAKS